MGGFASGLRGSAGEDKMQDGEEKGAKKIGSWIKGIFTKDTKQSFKKGGMVKRTGMAKVHRGERVLTKVQAKKMRKRY